MNQLELEQEMVDGGRDRARHHIERNEEQGRGHDNPYAQAVYRRYVQPLADLIQTFLSEVKRGVQSGVKPLLRDFEPLTLSYLTVRAILDSMVEEDNRLVRLSTSLGRTV